MKVKEAAVALRLMASVPFDFVDADCPSCGASCYIRKRDGTKFCAECCDKTPDDDGQDGHLGGKSCLTEMPERVGYEWSLREDM